MANSRSRALDHQNPRETPLLSHMTINNCSKTDCHATCDLANMVSQVEIGEADAAVLAEISSGRKLPIKLRGIRMTGVTI